jgi:hypothetical protein
MTDTANNWLSSRKIGLPMLRQVNRNINILKTEAIILDVGNFPLDFSSGSNISKI